MLFIEVNQNFNIDSKSLIDSSFGGVQGIIYFQVEGVLFVRRIYSVVSFFIFCINSAVGPVVIPQLIK